MKQSIEKNIVPVSLGTIATVLISAIVLTYSFSTLRTEIVQKFGEYDVKIALLEQQSKANKELFDAMKGEMEQTNKTIMNIYLHLTGE